MRTALFFGLLLLPIHAYGAEVTAATVLRRGAVLSGADISVVLAPGENMEAVRGAYIGQQLKRTVYAGHKIKAEYVGAPVLVKRNDQVSMVYTYGAMQILAKGRALQAGAQGETITVMNVSSRTKVLAVVLEGSLVEVGG